MATINIAIVEDNAELLRNLQLIFSYYDELKVVATYNNAEDFVAGCNVIDADVVVMDINLPGMSGIQAIEKVKPKYSNMQFLICTIYEDEDNIYRSLCSGASGYILKNTSPEKFCEAIKDIHNGGSPMSSNIARKVVAAFRNQPRVKEDYHALSGREREILDLLAKGYRYKEIAADLFISLETVRTHIRNIYEKLQVNSRTEALNKVRG